MRVNVAVITSVARGSNGTQTGRFSHCHNFPGYSRCHYSAAVIFGTLLLDHACTFLQATKLLFSGDGLYTHRAMRRLTSTKFTILSRVLHSAPSQRCELQCAIPHAAGSEGVQQGRHVGVTSGIVTCSTRLIPQGGYLYSSLAAYVATGHVTRDRILLYQHWLPHRALHIDIYRLPIRAQVAESCSVPIILRFVTTWSLRLHPDLTGPPGFTG